MRATARCFKLHPCCSAAFRAGGTSKKNDVYLQKTVGGLLLSIGCIQLSAAESEERLSMVRQLGIATALTLLAIDVVYIPKGHMRMTYLQDAVCEMAWIWAWLKAEDGGGSET